MAVFLVVAGDVFDGVLFCAVLFSHEVSWMRSGIELSQFLRIFLPTLFHADYTLPLNLMWTCATKCQQYEGLDGLVAHPGRMINRSTILHDVRRQHCPA